LWLPKISTEIMDNIDEMANNATIVLVLSILTFLSSKRKSERYFKEAVE
jgi:hypothetical protein